MMKSKLCHPEIHLCKGHFELIIFEKTDMGEALKAVGDIYMYQGNLHLEGCPLGQKGA